MNVLEKTVYIRMRNRVLAKPEESIYLMDIAQIIAPESVIPELKKLKVSSNNGKGQKYYCH